MKLTKQQNDDTKITIEVEQCSMNIPKELLFGARTKGCFVLVIFLRLYTTKKQQKMPNRNKKEQNSGNKLTINILHNKEVLLCSGTWMALCL